MAPTLDGQKYCVQCRCRIAGCRRPRSDHAIFCLSHAASIGEVSEPVQSAFATRDCIQQFLPCDIQAYDVAHPQLKGDFVWECILAAVQEPQPTQIITRHVVAASSDAANSGAHHYGTICTATCRELDGVSTPEVWKNLTCGFLAVMEGLGIVEAINHASSDAVSVRLGSPGIPSSPKAIAPEKRWHGLRKLVTCTKSSKSLPAPVDVPSVRENDRLANELLEQVGQPLALQRMIIRRKRLRSMLLELPQGEKFWQGMLWADFVRNLAPDMADGDRKAFGDEMLITEVVAMFGLCPKVGALLLPTAISSWSSAIAQDRNAVLMCIRAPSAVTKAHQARP